MRMRQALVAMCILSFALGFSWGQDLDPTRARGDEPSSSSFLERVITSFGLSMTLDDNLSGVGAAIQVPKTMVFFKGNSRDGAYLLLFVVSPIRVLYPTDVHTIDLKLLGLGYRGQTFVPNFGYSVSLGITQGSSSQGTTILGNGYFGVAPELGLYYPHDSAWDLGLYVTPWIHLMNFGGAAVANDYIDASLLVSIKALYEKRPRSW